MILFCLVHTKQLSSDPVAVHATQPVVLCQEFWAETWGGSDITIFKILDEPFRSPNHVLSQ